METASPQTPSRAPRVPQPRRAGSEGIRVTTPNPNRDQNPNDRESELRAQLLHMQQQIAALTSQMSARQNPVTVAAPAQQHLSREYWATPIDKSIKYPGEDAANNAKTAYLQRLDAYIAKSAPIHDLLSGDLPCPIKDDDDAIQALKITFGDLWTFEPKDLKRSLALLKRDHLDIHTRIFQLLNDGSTSTNGSWLQRNAALYTAVCDTLDLSKSGKDLDFLEVVDANNGLAIYNLAKFRLREIKSTDPLARAIKLQMGLQHIKYIPQPHGVAKYFAKIESHRTELASLPRPKIIDDWEVTAKVLRELPHLHPQFKSAADILEVQRKILKVETTLEDCRKAFISADIDNDVGGDLHSKNSNKGKRKLRTNLSRVDKRPRRDGDKPRKLGRHNYGDCAHHPKSNTHTTKQCINPFGLRSAFGLAISYMEKCTAVKRSVQAGWSPKATQVRVPQGYGCDNYAQTGKTQSALLPAHPQTPTSISANVATVPPAGQFIHPAQYPAFHHARPTAVLPMAPAAHQQPLQHPGYVYAHSSMQHLLGSPIRNPHVMPAYGPAQRIPINMASPGFPPQQQLRQQPQPTHHPPFTHQQPGQPTVFQPAPIAANNSSLDHGTMPQPTQEDLITAGIRYYATQAGNQDFH